MAGPVEAAFQAVVVVVAGPAADSPEPVLGRGVSARQAPATRAASSRTRPGTRRAAGVIVVRPPQSEPYVDGTLRRRRSGRMSIEIQRRCGLLTPTFRPVQTAGRFGRPGRFSRRSPGPPGGRRRGGR